MTEGEPEPPGGDDWAEHQAHYAAVGYVASEWAWFELWVDFKILELGGIPSKVGLCITSQVAGSARKLDAYIALSKHLGAKKTIKALNDFAKDTKRLAEQRNRVVHDPWVTGDGGAGARIEATARSTLRFLEIPVDRRDIEQLRVKIESHTDRFEALHQAVLSELSASP